MRSKIMNAGLIMGLSIAALWHISNIWLYGSHFIVEPNKIILWLEGIMLLTIFLYGVCLLIAGMRR